MEKSKLFTHYASPSYNKIHHTKEKKIEIKT